MLACLLLQPEALGVEPGQQIRSGLDARWDKSYEIGIRLPNVFELRL